jgi:hypothetical protein
VSACACADGALGSLSLSTTVKLVNEFEIRSFC